MLLRINLMPGKCFVFNCRSNYDDGPKETVSFFLNEKKDHDIRLRLMLDRPRRLFDRRRNHPYVESILKVPIIFDSVESHLSAESKHLK